MTTESGEFTISDELKSLVGREIDLGTAVIEAGAIAKFADAIKDPNPLYRDEEYAKGTPYGGIIAPPTFIHCFRDVGYARFNLEPLPWEKTTGLNGGNEFEIYGPMRPGDVITGKAKLVDIYARQSRSLGPMLFHIVEMTYTNQNNEVVGKQRSIGITYEAKE